MPGLGTGRARRLSGRFPANELGLKAAPGFSPTRCWRDVALAGAAAHLGKNAARALLCQRASAKWRPSGRAVEAFDLDPARPLIVHLIVRVLPGSHADLGFWKSVAIMTIVTLITAVTHLIEIALWAMVWLLCGGMATFESRTRGPCERSGWFQ
jgi:hypothetical protein